MEFRTCNWLLTALQLCTHPDQTFRWHLNMGQHGWKNWKFELKAQTAFQWQLPLMSHAGEEVLLSLHFPSPVTFSLDLFTLGPLYWLITLRDLTSHSIILAGQLCDILLPPPHTYTPAPWTDFMNYWRWCFNALSKVLWQGAPQVPLHFIIRCISAAGRGQWGCT